MQKKPNGFSEQEVKSTISNYLFTAFPHIKKIFSKVKKRIGKVEEHLYK